MIIRKALPLALACGLLVSTPQPTKAISMPPLAVKAFGVDFWAGLIIEFSRRAMHDRPDEFSTGVWGTALIAGTSAACFITDICLLRAAILGKSEANN